VLSVAKKKQVNNQGSRKLPNDSCSGAEVETILDEAVAQSQRQKVAGSLG